MGHKPDDHEEQSYTGASMSWRSSSFINLTFVELSKLDEVVKKPVSDMTDLDKWSVFFQYAPDMEHREIVNKAGPLQVGMNVSLSGSRYSCPSDSDVDLPSPRPILPPSDDRVFKLILTSPEAKQGLMNLISWGFSIWFQ